MDTAVTFHDRVGHERLAAAVALDAATIACRGVQWTSNRRAQIWFPVAAAPAPLKAPSEVPEGLVAVTAPSVGVFYRRPAPDQAPFVQVGSHVSANDPLCLIEVMKMFTGVVAPCKGRVAEILVEDASMVEYGQPLMYIEPA